MACRPRARPSSPRVPRAPPRPSHACQAARTERGARCRQAQRPSRKLAPLRRRRTGQRAGGAARQRHAWPARARTVLMPTTRPAMSSSGPPLLPGLMAASVWMAPAITPPSWLLISRPRPLMTPGVRAARLSTAPATNAGAPPLPGKQRRRAAACPPRPGSSAPRSARRQSPCRACAAAEQPQPSGGCEGGSRAHGGRTGGQWECKFTDVRAWECSTCRRTRGGRTGRQRVRKAERVAERVYGLADAQVGGRAERRGPQPAQHAVRRPDLQHAQVLGAVGADQVAVERLRVAARACAPVARCCSALQGRPAPGVQASRGAAGARRAGESRRRGRRACRRVKAPRALCRRPAPSRPRARRAHPGAAPGAASARG